MKLALGFLTLIASITAFAAQPETDRIILLSCSGITYDNKNAVQLVVTTTSDHKLHAVVRATNGEKISIELLHGFGRFIPLNPKTIFSIHLDLDGNKNKVMLNWTTPVLTQQYMHQPMYCAEKTS